MNNEQKINIIHEIIDASYYEFRKTNNIIFYDNNSTKEEIKECIQVINKMIEEKNMENLKCINDEYTKLSIAVETIKFHCNQIEIIKCNSGLCKMWKNNCDCYLEELIDYLYNIRDVITHIRLYNVIL